MKKIFVMWFLVQSFITGPEVKPDQYTGLYPNFVNAIACYKQVEQVKQEEFPSIASAEAFVGSAPANIRSVMNIVVLDAVKVGP